MNNRINSSMESSIGLRPATPWTSTQRLNPRNFDPLLNPKRESGVDLPATSPTENGIPPWIDAGQQRVVNGSVTPFEVMGYNRWTHDRAR
jgi:hypothetical protein